MLTAHFCSGDNGTSRMQVCCTVCVSMAVANERGEKEILRRVELKMVLWCQSSEKEFRSLLTEIQGYSGKEEGQG